MAKGKSNISRKIVGNKVYTYNSNKLIRVSDRVTGDTTSYDITNNNKKSVSRGSGSSTQVKSTPKPVNNKNADGTWKNQTMVTGSYFGAQSNQQQNKPQIQNKPKTTPTVTPAPQVRQISVSNKKNTSMRERIAENNKGKVAVAGKGLVDRGSESKEYKIPNANVKALQEAYVQKNGPMTQAKPMTKEVYAKIRNIQKVQQGVDIKDVTNPNTQKYLTDLANKENINEVDKREIDKAISRIDDWGRKNMFDYSDPETRSSLQTLRAKLDARANAGASIGAGMVDAMVPGLDYIKENAEKASNEALKGTAWQKGTYRNGDPNIDYQKANPLAYGIGQTIGSIVTMETAGSAIGSGVSKGLGAAVKAGKISAKAAKWIGIGANNTGLAALMTTKDALRKDYDWDNFGTDFLKQALMFNAMGYSAQGISSGLGSLLKSGGKYFSNAWQTARKVGTAAGSAGVGVAATVPFNSKEENENLLNQWITLTAFQAIPSILGGYKEVNGEMVAEGGIAEGRERGRLAAEGIKSAGSDLKQAEAIYKEAIMAENRGDLKTAKMLYDRANATARQVAELIYGEGSDGLYGVKQSDKELLKDALNWIVNNSNFEANTGVDFRASFGSALPNGSQPLQLTEGAKLLPGEVSQPDLPTPTLDRYAGGKAVMDAIIGRQTAPADTMPTIAKYGGAEVAEEAATANNVIINRAQNQMPMIAKYGGDIVAAEADLAVKYKIDPDFTSKYDAWASKASEPGSRQRGGYFVLGTTSEALKSIGVDDKTTIIDQSKIVDVLQKHPEINDSIIKQIPDLLENPILVMQSKSRLNSITLLGEVYGENGIPVLAAMRIADVGRRARLDDFNIVSSVYTKNGKNGTQGLIDSSDILFVEPDKKRTNDWLSARRLQLPVGITNYGPIHNVTLYTNDVNSDSGMTAIEAAFRDAQNRNGGTNENGNDVSYEIGQRQGSESSGIEVNSMGESTTSIQERTDYAERIRESGEYREVTNVTNGNTETYLEITNEELPESCIAIREELGKNGLNARFCLDSIEVTDVDGNVHNALGLIKGDDVILSINDPDVGITALHEKGHFIARVFPDDFATFKQEVFNSVPKEIIDSEIAKLEEDYNGIERTRKSLEEELLADVYSGRTTVGDNSAITKAVSSLNAAIDGKSSVKNVSNNETENRKQAQLDIIQQTNPMRDDYHLGIRSVDDIKTYEEIVSNPDLDEEFVYPDWSLADAKQALEAEKITVYSSYPIGEGVFVTPSKMMAQDYAGSGNVYSAVMDPKDIAWINGDEGQIATINDADKASPKFNPNDDVVVKLQASIPALKDMAPVSHIKGSEFKKSKVSLLDQVTDFFNKLGNLVTRDGFGDVILSRRGAKTSIGHGVSRAKAAAFAAVPDVIKNGRQIDYQQKWKGRNYDTYIFAAPITVGNSAEPKYVAVVVRETSAANRYELHEIVDQDGNIIFNKKTQETPVFQDRSVGDNAFSGESTVLSNDNVPQAGSEVNTAGEETAVSKPKLNSKLSKQYDKAVKEFTDNAFNLMNVPNKKVVQAELKAEINKIAADAFETGAVDDAAVTDLISRMWDAGAIYENHIQDTYPDLKPYFNKTAIKVSDAIQRDITDYNAWRKSQMGNLNITHNTGTPVDVVYQELSARYPALFPENIINPTEQLMRMAAIRQQMRGTTRSNSDLYSDDQRAEIASMANRLVDTLEKKITGIAAESRGEAIPGYSPEDLLSLDAQDPLNQDPDWISLQQQEPVVETEGEKLKNWKETKRRVSLTSQVLDMTRRVQKAAKTAQPELRAKMIEEFGTIVPYFKGMSDGKRINLKKQIDDLDRFRREVPGAKQYVWDSAAGTYKEDDPIMKIMNQLNGKLIAEMTNDELYQLFKNGQMMLHQLQTAKKEIREQGAREISDLSDNLVKQMKTAGPKAVKDNSVADFFTVKMLRPETFAKEVDGYAEDGVMQRLVEDIREGQTKAIDFKNRANDLFKDFADRNKKLIEKEWAGKKEKWHDTGVVPINGSETIKLTPGLRIAVYLSSLDYDAMRHMVGGQYRGDDGKMHVYDGGGITVPDQKLWEKGKYEEAKAAGKNYKVTEKMVERIIDTMTPEEEEWADIAFKKYYNGLAPTEGNKTSLAVDGWERFIKKNYYRIITDENYTQTVFDSLINDSTIEGQGMLKERVKGAHNPILLVDAFEALDSHIDGMSKYVGLVAPIRNFMKVYNYNDGDVSVKAALNERMGLAGKNYIKKYITDLQGGGKKSGDGRVMSKIRSGYAGSTLTLNPGVVFMQSASLPTAASYLGFGNVIKGLARKVDAETVKKYSVYYRYRSKGNYTADFDDLTKNKTMLDKMPLFNWIQQMDNATVRKLWGACECYVEEHFPNLKKGSEEYLVQVGKTLDKCVSLTQPNYTTAERPEILRSDNELVKSLTMFKTQPLQNFNLVLEAVRNVFFKDKAYRNARKEGRTGRKEKEELKKARKGLAQTIGAVTVAAVMIAAIRGASEMLKGRWENFVDENGEFSLEGLFNYMGKETGGSLAGSVIGGNELYSFISSMIDENSNYYDVSAPQLSVINDFTTAIKNVYDVFSAVSTGDKSPKALFRSAEKLAETIATMFGIPVANARKYVCGIIGNFSPEFKAEYEDLMYGVDLGDVKNASGEGWGSWLFGGMADTDAYFNKYFENRNGKGIKTEYRDEIKRLLTDYKEITGDVNGMFLSDPDKYTYNGITYELKQDDKDAIRQMAQAEASANINALMGKRAFAGLTDEQKIKAIKEINSLAAENAKNQWLSDHNQSVEKGKDFDKVSYAIFKASVNDDMTSAEKKQKLLDLNFNDYATASVYEKYFETKSTKEENTIAYKMEHTSKSAADIIREGLQEKAEKEKSAKESVVNNSATKIKEAEGYTLPNFRASTLQAIADIGISPEDYAYVSDRLDGHEDKVDYINNLPFDVKTKQGLVDDLIMGDKAHDKMKVAEEDYNIPNSTYIDTYMFGYESTGSKKERNQKIQNYVNDLPGLNQSQKDYLYWANQVYRKKEAVGGGESGSYSGYENSRSSGGGRRSGRRRSSGGGSSGGSGGSSLSGAIIPEAQGYATPKYRKDKLAKISDMGLAPSDYAYVADRVASTDNKVGYIKSLNLGSKATQGLINDLVMDANSRRKMTVGTQDYGIPANTYTQAFMYAYETTGSKAERNAKIKAYVNAITGLDSKQKTYLSWAVQANRSNGQTEGSGGSSGGTSSAKVSVKAAPSVSRKSVSSIGKSAVSKYIAGSVAAKAKAQKNADYAAQVKNIDSNVFMTAKQKAAAKRRLKAALGE